jgi:hypothetical protein
MYVNDITNKKVDKEYYRKFTTGELLESAEKVGEVEYEENSRAHKVKKAHVKILNKNCQEMKCVLTYVVSYESGENGKMNFATETKKLAEFVKEEDHWKISSVTNIKTFHEALESINPMEEN